MTGAPHGYSRSRGYSKLQTSKMLLTHEELFQEELLQLDELHEHGLDLCDAAVHRLVVDGRSVIIDFGRATRTISAHLRELLDLRDGACRWPGCDRPARWCDGHHVVEWDDGGETRLDNLALLCRRHHRRLHAGRGHRAKLLPDATLEITFPDGRVGSTTPPGVLPAPFW